MCFFRKWNKRFPKIWVLRYNDESSFHLENDFQMNPSSSQTWGPSGQQQQPKWGPNGFYHLLVSRTAMWWHVCFRRKGRSFLMTMKIYFWFKMFLENINVSFIKTVINPLYDVTEYVLCKGLNIHLYLSYEINWKTQTNF